MKKPLVALGALVALALPLSGSAYATTTPNPWTYTMTVQGKDGLVVNGMQGSLNQILTVKDPYGAPIFSVGHVGGAGVYGDRLAIFPPNSVTSPVIVLGDDGRISITGPNAGVWVDGQLLTSADIAWIHAHE